MAEKKISELDTSTLAAMKTAGAYIPMAVENDKTYKVPASDISDNTIVLVATFDSQTQQIEWPDSDDVVSAVNDGRYVTIEYRNPANYVDKFFLYGYMKNEVYRFSSKTNNLFLKKINGAYTWTLSDSSEYEAGDGIDITNGEISVKLGTGLEFEDDGGVKVVALDIEEIQGVVTEEVEEAVETLHSKIIYTLDLGSVQGGNTIQGNGSIFAKGTLFSPNMDQEINTTDSKIFYATNQTGNCDYLYLCLYEYDLATNTINWVANTDNVASQVSTTGLHAASITQCKDNAKLSSSKLYFLVILTNANSVKFIGNTYSENLNTTPKLGWYTDNLSMTDRSDPAEIKTTFATMAPQGESLYRFFAAISNVSVSQGA
ncbi:hypothetical protein [Fibrobacter sp. UWH4]|uniref:hypothetical protein n=1 Tax=Fibrobacter sp. UWH4 TaxID=1896210 RepID=UPI000912A296|nr:hypothetical protein [Fibrobacter sp. UWH4]SHL04357.1 hypothetical protein SAMN05720762_10446 [Fibrobacter sp. UWH4]